MILTKFTEKDVQRIIQLMEEMGVEVIHDYHTKESENCIYSHWSLAFKVKERDLDDVIYEYYQDDNVRPYSYHDDLLSTIYYSVPFIFYDGPYLIHCYDFWLIE